ncbi:MAG: hypothetical protein U0K54_07100 [Acutalibacteraceae bacterium]|nr:hypothetical protein [Acutalibacteraceae bacterium]
MSDTILSISTSSSSNKVLEILLLELPLLELLLLSSLSVEAVPELLLRPMLLITPESVPPVLSFLPLQAEKLNTSAIHNKSASILLIVESTPQYNYYLNNTLNNINSKGLKNFLKKSKKHLHLYKKYVMIPKYAMRIDMR